MSSVDPAEPRKDPATGGNPTWLVWALLAVGAVAAVFTAVREHPAPSSVTSAQVKPKAKPRTRQAAAQSSAVRVAPRRAVTAESLLNEQCPGKPASDCACVEQASLRGLTLGAIDSVLTLSGGVGPTCSSSARLLGYRAEALARSGGVAEALALLPQLSALDPKSASVPYVRAIAALKKGATPEATREATAALELGRGAPAHVAIALAAFQDNELDKASASLRRALETSPEDVDALYNLAVIDQRQNRYTAARNGYLRVLRLRPDHADARANLALLALKAGAIAEARHHQEELEKIVPEGDERALKLSSALSKAGTDEVPILRAPK